MTDSIVPTKICTVCGVEKPATLAFFHRHSQCKYGVHPKCKVCLREERKRKAGVPLSELRIQERSSHPDTFTDDPQVRRIPVGGRNGLFTLVDATDFPALIRYSWHLDGCGYAITRTRAYEKETRLARLIMKPSEGLCVDHINRDRLDNRRCNLRLATYSQNNANKKLVARSSKTGFRGVYKAPTSRRFSAQIRYGGKTHRLGLYDSPEEAAKAYDAAARYIFGEFATTNFEGDEKISPADLNQAKGDSSSFEKKAS